MYSALVGVARVFHILFGVAEGTCITFSRKRALLMVWTNGVIVYVLPGVSIAESRRSPSNIV